MSFNQLHWPEETTRPRRSSLPPLAPYANHVLDCHGDPQRARLSVFSDGNHHMALGESLRHFCERHPELQDIFYLTLPPGLLLNCVHEGGLQLGNLTVRSQPHVFISPAAILDKLVAADKLRHYAPFMQSRGNVLLFRRHNPLGIRSARDLLRHDVRLFLSNPGTETASHTHYCAALQQYAQKHGLRFTFLESPSSAQQNGKLCYGEHIHHREAPWALMHDRADVAVVYYHLALRYSRIFPECFAFIGLEGETEPDATASVTTTYQVGLMNDSGEFGQRLLDFLMSDIVTTIYHEHGLARPPRLRNPQYEQPQQ